MKNWEGWVAYTRVSTKDPTQLRALTNHIQRFQELGLSDDQIFSDVGSGTDASRSDFQAVLALIKSRKVTGILLARQDRIVRDSLEWEQILKEIYQSGTQVRFLDEGAIDLNQPDGRFMSRVKASVAQYYVEELAVKVRAGQERRRMRGHPHHVPFGWTIGSDGKPCLNHEPFQDGLSHAQAARQFIDWMLLSRSASQTVKTINAYYGISQEGRTTRERQSQRGSRKFIGWYNTSFRSWLRNPIHRGHLRFFPNSPREQILYNNHPERLMTEDEYLEIERIISSNRTTSGRGSRRIYPVSGLTRCLLCGGAFTAHGSYTRFETEEGPQKRFYCYYSCQTQMCSNDAKYSLKELEMNVQRRLQMKAELLLQSGITEITSEKTLEEISIEEKIAALKRVPGALPEIQTLVAQLTSQLDHLRISSGEQSQKSTRLQQDLIRLMQQDAFWQVMSPEDRKAVYHQFVSEIRLGRMGEIEIDLKV
ncbi:MAG: recombinase family protein [Synechococcaceae cyanobacterium SM2_3_2]|nr:recombinase family protein [Synechococcaceae cyanobacterium SM2_3_2]